MKHNIKTFLDSLALAPGDEWQLAFRRKEDISLVQGNTEGFVLIPNSIKYWYADPFLFEYKGKTYVFAEMYDRTKKKGALGWAVLKGNRCTKFKECLELQNHLSYPCVFERNNKIYMIPECYQSGEVSLYKAVDFPEKWEKEKTLFKGMAVDTTPVWIKDDVVYFTTIFKNANKRLNNNLHLLDDFGKVHCVVENDFCVRSAGMIFVENGRIIRPTQNCSDLYGSQIIMKEILNIDANHYHEKKFKTIGVIGSDSDIILNIQNKHRNIEYVGIHTYNANASYEIIDLKYLHAKSIIYFIQNVIFWIKTRWIR